MAKKRKKKTRGSNSKAASESVPSAELDVLACLWQEGPVTARRIREMMRKYRPMAHGSVVTLLTRLEDKGMVSKKKGNVGKAFLFSASRKPEPMYRKLTKEMVNRVFAGNVGTMVCALFDAQPPTKAELVGIQKAVNSSKRKAKSTRRR